MIDLWHININNLSNIDEKNLLKHLGEDEIQKAKSFAFERLKRNFLIRRFYLRAILSNYTGEKKKKIEYVLNDFKKPFLLNNPNIYFNVSHSENMILVAIADQLIGVDVEKIVKTDVENLFPFVFSREEEKNIPLLNKIEYFYNIWCIKESYLKYIGIGLNVELKDINCKFLNNFYLVSSLKNDKAIAISIKISNNYMSFISVNNHEAPNIKTFKDNLLLFNSHYLRWGK